MKNIIAIFFFVFPFFLHSQGEPVVEINFNNCSTQVLGNFNEPTIEGNTNCDCGIVDQSLTLTEFNNALVFDSSYTELLQSDFTLSFYFMLDESSSGIIDILSVSKECGIDSSLTIKYLADDAQIRVQMAEDFAVFVELRGTLDLDRCWHQLVFQRNDQNYSLFLDGAFSDNSFFGGDINLDPTSTMKFSKSPCQAFGEEAFRGKIDEFLMYDRVLSIDEVFDLYTPYDQILTPDTTIFSNTSLDIRQTFSCAENFVWSPNLNVFQADDLEPTVSPEQTTTYFVRYNYGICSGLDSVRISIIDEDLVECENLLIPNAFSPNNDGLNDRIGISNAFIVDEIDYFHIFDRWGEKVFSGVDKNDSWDGNFRNQKVNSNVFLYKINYSCGGEEFIKSGSFSILR